MRRYIARELEPPVYGPRKPRQRLIDPFVPDFARLILPAWANFHWETGAKLLKLLERVLTDFYQMRIEIIG